MQVTNITVRFRRQVQPAQYEAAEAVVEYSAVVDDGEDHAEVSACLMTHVRDQALAAVGKTLAKQAVNTPEAAKVRGAPRGAKAQKAEKAKREQETAEAAKVTEPQDQEPQDKEPWEADAKKPDTPVPAPAQEITDQVLQAEATEAAKRGGVDAVKDLMKEFGVARLGAIPEDKRAAFVEQLQAAK